MQTCEEMFKNPLGYVGNVYINWLLTFEVVSNGVWITDVFLTFYKHFKKKVKKSEMIYIQKSKI